MNDKRKAIVIGSGIAGMAAAIRLTVQGFETSVYERNAYPGGKLSEFVQDGYRFDAGPSLFTQPERIAELFELANAPIQEYIQWERVPVTCRYFFSNGKIVSAYAENELLAQEISEQLGEPPENILNYLKESAAVYDDIGRIFLNHPLNKKATWLHGRIWKALRRLKISYLFSSMHQHNRKRFAQPETIQLFNRYATYNGSNPFRAPAMLSVIPHLELNEGTYYPKGGMIQITNALYRLACAKGVQFHFNTPAERIILHEGRAKGIVANQQNLHADIVISNADAYFTYLQLLRDQETAGKLLRQERSSSAVIFYWGIQKSFPELQLHNIFFSENYQQEFEAIFKKHTLYHDPTIYINITSKMEAGLAPEGCENWFVMINAPANRGQNWEQLVVALKEVVIRKLSQQLGTDIAPLIATERIHNPTSIESETGSYMGSLYGTSSNSKMAAFARHSNDSSTINGLYFCGGSVHPGGGIPLCLRSAAIVSDLIAQKKSKPTRSHHS